MTLSTPEYKQRLANLAERITKQHTSYTQGYHQAMLDNGLVLDDVPLHETSDEYRHGIYVKAFTTYPLIH